MQSIGRDVRARLAADEIDETSAEATAHILEHLQSTRSKKLDDFIDVGMTIKNIIMSALRAVCDFPTAEGADEAYAWDTEKVDYFLTTLSSLFLAPPSTHNLAGNLPGMKRAVVRFGMTFTESLRYDHLRIIGTHSKEAVPTPARKGDADPSLWGLLAKIKNQLAAQVAAAQAAGVAPIAPAPIDPAPIAPPVAQIQDADVRPKKKRRLGKRAQAAQTAAEAAAEVAAEAPAEVAPGGDAEPQAAQAEVAVAENFAASTPESKMHTFVKKSVLA